MYKPTISSYSNQLAEKWKPELKEASTINFRAIAGSALNEFSEFKTKYEKGIKDLFIDSFRKSGKRKPSDLWLEEQINLALDGFWEPLAHIAEQIKAAPYLDFFSNNSTLQKKLDMFKANIRELLGQGSDHLPNDILVYFNKTTKINRFPYTDKALIGIPYRVLSQDQNDLKTWMPIAHELGHHIYWNMSSYIDLPEYKENFEKGILNILKDDHGLTEEVQRVIKPWMEEIFADAIGLRISGTMDGERKIFLESSKELILRKTDSDKTNLSLDDGEHVPDGLRLIVSIASLGDSDPISYWKVFLENEIGIDVEELKINLRDEFGEPLSDTIASTVVASQISNAVRIILDEVGKYKQGSPSIFNIQAPSSADFAGVLIDAAKKMGRDDPDAVLGFALTPEILEAGQGGPSHTHLITYGQANNHTHPSYSFTHKH